ncbi:uncharacterized protein A4U43_C07F35320 [Asparagus officinalis]|uniref:Uncharacterized protein n=1 Tax=Asparagus officinalis TaxID=4686 RepID=A0A5P1EKZ8_ASPOF|nr:protein DCL, chloroplastic-like [Asparagus officinalis]ONK65261.1 uncharacterized protein A4U43_C07F35320 [Asparagus officinalis]
MAEVISEAPQSIEEKTERMEASSGPETLASKRGREEEEENRDEIPKKPKVDDESTKEAEIEMKGKEEEKPSSAKLGPKEFGSGEDMFDYFFKFLHYWPPNLDVNKYEHLVLLELLRKGHTESDKKIGGGIQAFQVRYHPMWKSRCFFLVRIDGSSDDFSFRKCVDHMLPLPENMKIHSSSDGNKKFGGHNKGGGRGGGRGGRGGRGRGRGGFRK